MRLPKGNPDRIIDRTGASDVNKFGMRVKHAWNNTMSDIGFRQRKTEGTKDIWTRKKVK